MEDTEIIEGENYRKSEVFGFRELFLMQVRRCIDKQSSEMREGFWVYTNNPSMASQKTKYVGDSRDEFFNSVKSLHDLSQPKFDKVMKEQAKEIIKKIDERKEEIKKLKEKTETNKLPIKWKNEQVEFYRKLFQALCFFGNRLNWFENSRGEE